MGDEPHDLLDSIELAYGIECIACGDAEELTVPTPLDAAKQFEVLGWKRSDAGEVNCPECNELESPEEQAASKTK